MLSILLSTFCFFPSLWDFMKLFLKDCLYHVTLGTLYLDESQKTRQRQNEDGLALEHATSIVQVEMEVSLDRCGIVGVEEKTRKAGESA